jgi:hypothetical protein
LVAIKPERPSPLYSGRRRFSVMPAWGVLDYAVHTFAVSRVLVVNI